ncbi:MAG: cyclodeaminase [Gammaproteobacteria bacterium]|nr:cyclodeaminase [Gammaproteobacteria bacterium]NIR82951.1 cyclodeaminase [Gammaproteobacteria bacterium]NIR90316.1 cyclodeaminase [Gammaproteobacteria bacterium]NIU04097.1 cyclodeaminase [Gammaproteobacteria bacterium]NIV51393.1 cyclodeaminase [Gammaproteobacteria bacterium]
MASVLVLTESELRQCVGIDEEALSAVQDAFTWLAEGKAVMPPIMHIEIADNHGDVDIKSAYVSGLDSFAVKLGSGFFDNPKRGLPSSSAMMVLLSAKTGFCEAVLLDNGYLTDVRTGLAGAVAARFLAPRQVETVGVIGAGAQARCQIESLRLVRSFRRLLVTGRSPERVRSYVSDMKNRLDVEVVAAESLEQLVRESQVVISTTSSREPLVRAEWLHPGLHITAMGSDLAGKQELDPHVLTKADLLVCDRKSQCFTMGELQHGLAAGLISEDSPIYELGELTAGRVPGRRDEKDITVCDLTGTGVQDTAIALLAHRKCAQRGLGTDVSNP